VQDRRLRLVERGQQAGWARRDSHALTASELATMLIYGNEHDRQQTYRTLAAVKPALVRLLEWQIDQEFERGGAAGQAAMMPRRMALRT
jgi:hypothetical protein